MPLGVAMTVLVAGCADAGGAGDDPRARLDAARSSVAAAVDDVRSLAPEVPELRVGSGRGGFESCTEVTTTDPRYVAHLQLLDLAVGQAEAVERLAAALAARGWEVVAGDSSGHVPARRGDLALSAVVKGGAVDVRIESGCIRAPDDVAQEYVGQAPVRYRDSG